MSWLSSLQKALLARWTSICLGIVVVIFCSLSFWHIAESPSTWFDEGINFGIARSLAEQGVFSLPVAPDAFVEERSYLITTNYPVLIPVALAIKIGGPTLAVGRLPQILFMTLFCTMTFFLIRKKGETEAAVFAVALVVSFVPFYGNGKPVLGEIPALFYFLAGLLLLEKAGTFRPLVLVGLVLGLSAATKPFYLIVIPAVFIAELAIARRERTSFWSRFFPLCLGGILPLIVWLMTVVQPFTPTQFYKTFFFYSNSYAATGFADQVFTNIVRFAAELTPMHFALLGLFVFAYMYRRIRQREITRSEIALVVFLILTVGWYLKTPGWYRYFFPAHVIILTLFPLAAFRFLPRRFAIAFLAFIVLGQFGYLATKRHDPLYNSSETLRFAAAAEQAISAEAPILIVNNPSIAALFPGPRVYQFLQINPRLAFGTDTLLDKNNEPFAYIVTDGHPEAVTLHGLVDTLRTEYEPVQTVGRYILHRHKSYESR